MYVYIYLSYPSIAYRKSNAYQLIVILMNTLGQQVIYHNLANWFAWEKKVSFTWETVLQFIIFTTFYRTTEWQSTDSIINEYRIVP